MEGTILDDGRWAALAVQRERICMISKLKHRIRVFRESFPVLNNHYEWLRGRKFPIFLEFPVKPVPRYGFTTAEYEPMVSYLSHYSDRFRTVFSDMLSCKEEFCGIPRTFSGNPTQPYWINGTFPALDAMALYFFMTKLNPKRYVEIGSGNSTKFASLAIKKNRLQTQIISIDPRPRAEIDAICDLVIRDTLEKQDLRIFSELDPGDVVFFDGSHFSYQNSDTVVFFLDVLPRLPSGVWVQIHDINWPLDYGPESVYRYFTEQYLLAAYIIGGAARIDMQLANHFCSKQLRLPALLDPIFDHPNMDGVPRIGGSFWFSII